jgi:RNA polymerase sigma factor FliA
MLTSRRMPDTAYTGRYWIVCVIWTGARKLRTKARRIEEARRNLSARLGCPPSESQLAEELGMSLDYFQQSLVELRRLDSESLPSETMEKIPDRGVSALGVSTAAQDPFLLCSRSEMARLLAVAMGELPERDCLLLTLHYFEERTMRQVGQALGISQSRVSKLHAKVVVRLRERMRTYQGERADTHGKGH